MVSGLVDVKYIHIHTEHRGQSRERWDIGEIPSLTLNMLSLGRLSGSVSQGSES